MPADSAPPSFADLKRLEEILRSLLLRSVQELHRRSPSDPELDDLVRRELSALHRDFGEDFLLRLARHTPSDPGEPAPGTLLWRARLHGTPPPEPCALREWVDRFLRAAHPWSPLTLDAHRVRLNPFAAAFGDRTPESVTPQELVAHLLRWPSSSSRRGHWSTLNAFFQWLLRCDALSQNPVPLACARPHDVYRPRLVYTPAQTRRILEATQATDQIGFWTLSLFAGLRCREIYRLNRRPDPWSCIQLDRGVIDLTPDPHASTRRVIPIQPVLRAWLAHLKSLRLPFYPRRHWPKTHALQAAVLTDNATPPESFVAESHGMARRTFIVHRLALPGTSPAAVADETGLREAHLRAFFTDRATPAEAEEYFSLTPDGLAPAPNPPPPPQNPSLESALVEHFADLAAIFGLPKSHGRIYGLFYASPDPLSFTDVADRLDLSVGAVSLGLQALRDLGALHPAPGPVRHREHFTAEPDLPRLLATHLARTVQSRLAAASARLAALRSGPAGAPGIEVVLTERLQALATWQRQAAGRLAQVLPAPAPRRE